MIIIERNVQHIYPGKAAALDDLDRRYTAVEDKLGFPPKRRLSPLSGTLPLGAIVIEREWESLAAMETAYTRYMASAEIQALEQESQEIVESARIELYTLL